MPTDQPPSRPPAPRPAAPQPGVPRPVSAPPAAARPATSPPPAARPAPTPPGATPPAPEAPARLVSLDAFRGFVMLAMVSAGFGIPQVAEHFRDSKVWQDLGYQLEHVPWVGCSAWDL